MAYIADASKLQARSIVRIESPISSAGTPTYPHYFIVIKIADNLRVGDKIFLVGVSSGISASALDPARHIAMKWLGRARGDPETGFTKQCYACVDFTHLLQVYEGNEFALEVAAEFSGKFVRADKLQTIVAAMNALSRRG